MIQFVSEALTESTKIEPPRILKILSYLKFLWFIWCTGARIDHGHHASKAKLALSETVMLDEAVRVATEMTDEEDTLMIVTADHSHVFNIAGYPKRGNDILG